MRFKSREEIKKGGRVWWANSAASASDRQYTTGTVMDPRQVGQKVKIKKDIGGYVAKWPTQICPIKENQDPLFGHDLFPDVDPKQVNNGKQLKKYETQDQDCPF